MALHERWGQYTRKEITNIKKNNCAKHNCPYLGRISTINMRGQYANMCCNYVEITGHSRGCFPEDCRHWSDTGVKRKRPKILTGGDIKNE